MNLEIVASLKLLLTAQVSGILSTCEHLFLKDHTTDSSRWTKNTFNDIEPRVSRAYPAGNVMFRINNNKARINWQFTVNQQPETKVGLFHVWNFSERFLSWRNLRVDYFFFMCFVESVIQEFFWNIYCKKVDAWNVYCELVKHLDGVFCFKFIFPSENNKIDALLLESKSAKKFLNPLLTNGYRGNSKRVS